MKIDVGAPKLNALGSIQWIKIIFGVVFDVPLVSFRSDDERLKPSDDLLNQEKNQY